MRELMYIADKKALILYYINRIRKNANICEIYRKVIHYLFLTVILIFRT